jgi:type I restriction enzyme, S subunit
VREGWETAKLGDVCTFENGDRGKNYPSKSAQVSEGVPFVNAGHLVNGRVYLEKMNFITEERFNLLGSGKFFPGDTLFCLRGSLGKYGVVGEDVGQGAIASSLVIIRPKESSLLTISSRLLTYYLDSKICAQMITKYAGGAAQPNLGAKDLAKFCIPLPPLPEQERIVAILDEAFATIDQAIANTEKNLANAKELFDSELNRIFSQKGEGWVETTLGDVYDVRDGTHDSPKYQEHGYALITSKNLQPNGLSFEKVKYIAETDYKDICKRSHVERGDVLLAMIGTIGNPTVVMVEPNFAIKNVALFKTGPKRSGHFLRYYLSSPKVIQKMKTEAKGATQKFVGLGYLRNFPIHTPTNEIENEIAAVASQKEEKSKILQEQCKIKLKALDKLKQSLLQKAFTGELTVSSDALYPTLAEAGL